MSNRTIKNLTGILIFFISAGSAINAQTRNDVIAAYNEGAKSTQTNPQAAIKAFENVITLSDQVGETAADLKQKAIGVLPGLYYRVAANTINEKKPAQEIMQAAKAASAVAEKYGTETHKANAGKILVQAYNATATDYFSKNDYEKALITFDTLLSLNPGYVNALYNKALIYIKQSNSAAFEETIDLYLGKLESGKDDEKKKQASTVALEYFRSAGSKANQAESLDEALALLNKAAKYGDDKDLFYFFADVYNKKKNFDSGAEYAQKGLAIETGDADAKAKFYFQLGLAQEGKGQTADACNSFKNALYGAFAAPSKAKRTNLKCQ